MNIFSLFLAKFILTPLILVALPFLGLLLSGSEIGPYFQFPPLTGHIPHASFSWMAFTSGALINLLLLGSIFGIGSLHFRTSPSQIVLTTGHTFPWWGWLSFCTLILFWIFAWTRFSWFASFQAFTFTPLWLSFIVLINAHTYSRTGHSLVTDQPQRLFFLFVGSSLFWWYFEYLNRYVDNWQYIEGDSFSPLAYVLHSTVAFSTVLPAVCSVIQWFQSFFHFHTPISIPGLTPSHSSVGVLTLTIFLLASCGLISLSLWPNYLFSCLWIFPLVILLSIQTFLGEETMLSRIKTGNWHFFVLPPIAALFCGVWWETWNFYSMAKWVYSIPFVDRFHIFEMPILGFGGYLPFGWGCIVAIDFFSRVKKDRSMSTDWILFKIFKTNNNEK